MDTGLKISAFAHAGLIAWVMAGGVFSTPDRARPMEVAEVTLISGEEFAALLAPQATRPEPAAPPPDPQPSPPEPEPALPEPQPEPPQQAPEPEPQPEPAPVVPQPPVETVLPPATTPDISPVPAPRPAARVAPETAPPPPPEAEIAPTVQEALRPEPGPEPAPAEPERPATAPEEATTQIITEATRTDERGSAAPVSSPRPQSRPARPEPQRTAAAPTPPAPTPPQPTPQPAEPPADAIADAIAAALGESLRAGQAEPSPVASGPPLTQGERDALRVAVQQCWNVGALSTEALAVTVTVSVALGRDGVPQDGSIRMIDARGGSDAAARQAYEAARRAIIRCGAQGFDLPAEKYDHWRDIEMTFNPESMRIR